MNEVDQIVQVALAPKVNRGAFLEKLEKDADFVRSFLAAQGNEYLAKVPVIITEIQMDRNARAGAVA